ncbi:MULTISPECIES: arsenate reductase (glutaredoxin) [unclassified Olleya]|uniref:arsenate reductase (glutaredoxin) n=1 Tax=unclassified Olleya TaxID=2615019 RepID=UPI0011A252A0|nr:arsenate reductase (glutaredoxin) [Olleya sp. Hel_I_94]TVZ46648.1 arsenate reductase [Olleya sp. Hel_I_94]|tara:strand:- start:237 stop:578 length:342 start_codon:yes stop_codon:yes gene_type:complete
MIKIYHNPRCSKSRQGLQLLEDSNKKFEVIKYLETPLTEKELKEILSLLKIKPIDLVRKNEAIWKENYKNKTLTDAQVIEALINNPKLIERPIVTNNDKAVIGRPTELISSIL